jgi:hypothetical protein
MLLIPAILSAIPGPNLSLEPDASPAAARTVCTAPVSFVRQVSARL